MARARTFLKCEISDAAEAAASHGLRLTLRPTGEIEMSPAYADRPVDRLDTNNETRAESEFTKWKAKRGKTAGSAHH